MKSKIIILSLVTTTAVLLANAIVPYNKAKPPKLQLPEAYQLAFSALGVETNTFHCISANVETTFSHDGEWMFTFYSTNSKPKWISVEFNGKIHVETIMLR